MQIDLTESATQAIKVEMFHARFEASWLLILPVSLGFQPTYFDDLESLAVGMNPRQSALAEHSPRYRSAEFISSLMTEGKTGISRN